MMRTIYFMIHAIVLSANCISAQKLQIDNYFSIHPGDIKAQNSEIQEYNVTLKW